MGVDVLRPANTSSVPFHLLMSQDRAIESIPMASLVALETSQFSRIDASTLPATIPQQSTTFQYWEIVSMWSSLPSTPPSLETSPPALITYLSKLGTWIGEAEVIISTARGQALLNTNMTQAFSDKRNLLPTFIRNTNRVVVTLQQVTSYTFLQESTPEWGKALIQTRPSLPVHQWL